MRQAVQRTQCRRAEPDPVPERRHRSRGALASALSADPARPGRDVPHPRYREQDRVYRTRFFGHKVALSGGPHDGLAPGGSGVARAAQAVLLDQPLGVVAGDEVADGVTDLVDGLVDATVHDLLLQRAKESFDDTVRLGFAHERVAGGHAPEADLVVEMFGEERAAMVV